MLAFATVSLHVLRSHTQSLTMSLWLSLSLPLRLPMSISISMSIFGTYSRSVSISMSDSVYVCVLLGACVARVNEHITFVFYLSMSMNK